MRDVGKLACLEQGRSGFAPSGLIRRLVASGLIALGLSACASGPNEMSGLRSAEKLQPNPTNPNGLIYKRPGVDFKQFTKFIIPPVEVYSGADANFSNATEQEKQQIVDLMQREFTGALAERYAIVTSPGPGVARIKLTLAGIETNTPVLATAARVIPIGLAINAISATAGQQGMFMGSVTYAIEIFDSQSGELIAAALERRSPSAIDITATLGRIDAARSAVRDGANRLREAIDRVHGVATN